MKPREKSVFKVGASFFSDRVYAGMVRGCMFVGKKHDVTDSFNEAIVASVMRGKRSGTRLITVDGLVFEIRCKQLKIRPAKGAEK